MKTLHASGAAFGLAIMLASLSAAHAQEDPIAACQQEATTEARIACLEDALRRQAASRQPAAPTAQPAPARETRQESTDERQGVAGRVGSALGALNPFSGGDSRQSDDGQRQVSSQDAAADQFGASQVAARTASRTPASHTPSDRLAARIAQVSIVPYQRLEVTLDNGQVWRQIAGDRQRLNERHVDGNTVDIWEARLGGYQMRLNEISRTIRVERIR